MGRNGDMNERSKMRHLEDIDLTPDQKQSLQELHFQLTSQVKIESLILFGSVARGEADAESDIDLLVLTSELLSSPERHQITDLVFEINLKYGTNYSTLVVDQKSWDTGLLSILPIHIETIKDGVTV
jgi:uncharacterized protein